MLYYSVHSILLEHERLESRLFLSIHASHGLCYNILRIPFHLSMTALTVAHCFKCLQEVAGHDTAALHVPYSAHVYFRVSRPITILVLVLMYLVLHTSNASNPFLCVSHSNLSVIAFRVAVCF